MSAAALRAEWVKFRTVRGWALGLGLAAALCVVFTFLVAHGSQETFCPTPQHCGLGHAVVPTGPGGEAVADSYEEDARRLIGNGSLTVRVGSLVGRIASGPGNRAPTLADTRPGLAGWAKAGILLTASSRPGSAYAAVMATGGHGVRFQYDYTHDRAGLPGAVTSSAPRWLRLTRRGATIIAEDSLDGGRWRRIGTARLAGLPAAVTVGLFVTSPVSYGGAPSDATASFGEIELASRTTGGSWSAHSVGIGPQDAYPTLGSGEVAGRGAAVAITGSGDIAPAVATLAGGSTSAASLVFGIVVSLLVLIVIASAFITSEYRRGLIAVTLGATPRRGTVLAAKALVIAAVAFVVGVADAVVALPLAHHVLAANGNYIFPTTVATQARVILGTGLLLALTAVGALALGTILRRAAGAVTVAVVVLVAPSLLGPGVLGPSSSAATWLYEVTPAAAFSVFDVLPRSPLVAYPFTLGNGYYPLGPWAGLGVLAGYCAAALALAAVLLRRRDA